MNRKQNEAKPVSRDQGIRARVPKVIKEAVLAIAERRFTTESEITREALLEYLVKRKLITLPGSDANPSGPDEQARSHRSKHDA
jgi:hypothetical protein